MIANIPDTGERLLPSNEHSFNEVDHWQRYEFAKQFVANKSVLDVACGEGYGSHVLKQAGAKEVYGIDNFEDAITAAREHYVNVIFLHDDAQSLKKIGGKKFDVIVSFETIEHLSQPGAFLSLLKNHLAPNGILLLSTPNSDVYAKGNPHHIKEFTKQELTTMMRGSFRYSRFFSQYTVGGAIIEADAVATANVKILGVTLEAPATFLIVASNALMPKIELPKATLLDMTTHLQSIYQGMYNQNRQIEALQAQLHAVHETLKEITQSKKYKLLSIAGRVKKLATKGVQNPKKVVGLATLLAQSGPTGVSNKLKQLITMRTIDEQYQLWLKKHTLLQHQLEQQKKDAKALANQPLISVIVPTYNTPLPFLSACLNSVLHQTYENWQLCLADDASTNLRVRNLIKTYAKKDKRISYIFRERNGHISNALNSALSLAKGAYVGFLDHDDILWPNALYEVAQLLNEHSDAKVIYSDEDMIEEDGLTHSAPFFRPDYSPDYLRSINYITHFLVVERKLVEKIKGFREGYEGAQDWDLLLRLTQETDRFFHIPTVLYSWRKSRTSTASEKYGAQAKPYALSAQKKAFEDDLARRGLEGSVALTQLPMEWRVRYTIIGKPLVSIIIPTKEQLALLTTCIISILNKTSYENYEIVIVDTGSHTKPIKEYYRALTLQHNNIRVLHFGQKPFNFPSTCNFGAAQAKGRYLLFLNNDTEVITNDWIEGLLEHAQRKEVGSVGAMLLYPNNTIQHLGGIVGIPGDTPTERGRAGHAYKGLPKNFIHRDREAVKNYSFVSAACLMIAKQKFLTAKGFDKQFRIAFNDVDFGLRLYTELGLYNVVNPHVKLYHHESASVGKTDQPGRDMTEWNKELDLFIKRWDSIRLHDPFFNPNYSLATEQFDRLNLD